MGREGRSRRFKVAALGVVCGVVASACTPLMTDVARLSDDAMEGRDNQTPGSIRAQNYLIHQLKRFAKGLNSSQVGDAAFKQPFADGTNIVGVIPGRGRADEYVMIGAHYDHLGTACATVDDRICNGATDNATGVAEVLSIGRKIARLEHRPARSVILAFWDAEEDGFLGSEHYVGQPLVPLSRTIAYLNLDIQGANLLPSLRSTTFAVASETGGRPLRALVEHAASHGPLSVGVLTEAFGQQASDYVTFVNARIPTVHLSDSTGPCYHTADDELGVVDFRKLRAQSQIVYHLALGLAQTQQPVVFSSPTFPPTFDDAIVIRRLANRVIRDIDRFEPSQQAQLLQIRDDMNRIVAEGPAAFDIDDAITMGVDTLVGTGILRAEPCDGYLRR